MIKLTLGFVPCHNLMHHVTTIYSHHLLVGLDYFVIITRLNRIQLCKMSEMVTIDVPGPPRSSVTFCKRLVTMEREFPLNWALLSFLHKTNNSLYFHCTVSVKLT